MSRLRLVVMIRLRLVVMIRLSLVVIIRLRLVVMIVIYAVTISLCHDLSDNCFSFTSTLADAMRSMDVSRSPDSLISYSHFPHHVPPAHVLIRFPFHFTCFLTCTNMDCRLISSYLFVLHFLLSLVDLCTYVSRLCRSPFVLSTRLQLRILLMLTFCSLSTRLVLDSDSFTTHFPFTNICNCISQFPIYMVGDADLFPIFNLLCNHPKGVTCEIP